MQKATLFLSCALGAALAVGTLTPAAFAEEAGQSSADATPVIQSLKDIKLASSTLPLPSSQDAQTMSASEQLQAVQQAYETAQAEAALAEQTTKTLSCDPALLEAIGTQEATGHSICCSAFACAYGDAFVQGVANDHSYYGCTCCTWPNWGGGNSSFRDVGSSQALLREAYDQIQAGKPTVVHVAASYGEHWVTLVGYQNVDNPDELDLANFVCIDPWDGAWVTLGDRFTLYGDNCQHVSDQ